MGGKKSGDLIWQTPFSVVYCIYKIKKDMSSFMIKIRIREVESKLRNATDSSVIAKLESDLKEWKWILHDVEMQEFEDRVGFKSMERNAGVWDER